MNVYQTMKPSDGNLSIITMTIIITVIISASLMSNTTVYLYLYLLTIYEVGYVWELKSRDF